MCQYSNSFIFSKAYSSPCTASMGVTSRKEIIMAVVQFSLPASQEQGTMSLWHWGTAFKAGGGMFFVILLLWLAISGWMRPTTGQSTVQQTDSVLSAKVAKLEQEALTAAAVKAALEAVAKK
jgi:hypothetical protein